MSDSDPLVGRLWLIFQHLARQDDQISLCKPSSLTIKKLIYFQILTSDLRGESLTPSQPPVTLILPPTIEAGAKPSDLGREARGVQACAPGRRVITDVTIESSLAPPATTNA